MGNGLNENTLKGIIYSIGIVSLIVVIAICFLNDEDLVNSQSSISLNESKLELPDKYQREKVNTSTLVEFYKFEDKSESVYYDRKFDKRQAKFKRKQLEKRDDLIQLSQIENKGQVETNRDKIEVSKDSKKTSDGAHNNSNKSKSVTEQPKAKSGSGNKKNNSGNWRTFEVTMYTANVESTGKTPDDPNYGLTASGQYVQPYETIACPPSMEFGTKVYIKKLDNTYTCHDRGSRITAGHIDVYVKSLDRALSFGRRSLKIKILN